MTMALCAFLSVLCPDCNSVCQLRCDKSWRVYQGPSAVTEPCDLRFHVKIFLVTEIFVFGIQAKLFCIQAKVTYCWHSVSGMG